MDPNQITALAKLLRNNGDKVLNSEFKLTLSGTMIRALNDSFSLIIDNGGTSTDSNLQSFQVVKPNNSKTEAFRELQLIYDFVQKALSLCITRFAGDDYVDGIIDISKFRCLRRLEVQKIDIKRIHGLQPLRSQLQYITCIRSIQRIQDIITYCGGDHSNGFVWNELKIADFSYNALTTVDCSLEFAQWLQNLNLSHNQLTSVDAIKWLPNLKILDISFNRLTQIPVFHSESTRRLQTLLLSNNFIEDLNGISRLDALNELDLSNNCLLDHSNLLPLTSLTALRYLNLFGNPLYCHPKHRQTTAPYLHKNTASIKFILDTEELTKSEKSLTGGYHNYYLNLSTRLLTTNTPRSSGQSTPMPSSISLAQTPNSSVGSIKSFKLPTKTNDKMFNSMYSEKSQKSLKIRTVEIEDIKTSSTEINDDSILVENRSSKDSVMKAINERTIDHLIMKKQIEDLREKFGSEWLQNKNANLENVLGIEFKTKVLSSDLMIDFLKNSNLNNSNISTMNINKDENIEIPIKTLTPIEHIESPNQLLKIQNQFDEIQDTNIKPIEDCTPINILQNSSNLNDIFNSTTNESDDSEPEENEKTYVVNLGNTDEEIFLQVSDISIKEKDILTRKTKTKWSLKILESCERIKSNTIKISFDTIKKNKKERIYILEEGLCHELEKYLRDILSKRRLSEMNQIVYKCANCSTEFCIENLHKRNTNSDITCPECKSKYVIELHESPSSTSFTKPIGSELFGNIITESKVNLTKIVTSEISTTSAYGEKNVLDENDSNDSIGSAESLNRSSSCSKLSHESSFDSNQSVAGSSTNDRENDFNFSLHNKGGESDIEILSNPSQSSIEILDSGLRHSYNSSRKTSEERGLPLSIPLLEITEDPNLINNIIKKATKKLDTPSDYLMKMNKNILSPNQLTESSSSGSVTDSVCTAYEQQNDPIVDTIAPLTKPTLLKDKKREDSLISSMFGGLFQSTNTLMSKSQKITDNNYEQCDKFRFSYTDFSEVDHRIKLYLYQQIFEDQNEQLKWLVKGKICCNQQNSNEIFEGVVILSTTKFYILECFSHEEETISKWLKRNISGTMDRIESIQLLPFKIGLSFIIKGYGCFLLLLQDILRTDSLLLYFANNPLPDECKLDFQISEKLLYKITESFEKEQLKMFAIINKFEFIENTEEDEQNKKIQPLYGLFTTDLHLYITNSNISWLKYNSNDNIEFIHKQLMSNLIEVDRLQKNQFSINFLDENQDKYELWKCTFETEENTDCCLNAISQSWEKLFGVPLINN